ncbi:helix-turn-helix domain-containing protein [Nocardiopsis sp. EMB25]|uniref:helix-turn-helix domain-containing protein n=1 Tax=Nocardiopsis TaxID=2013 RepID=UPI000344BF44|nr:MULTISPECIES: helix-turn-helix domain-containing protein [Nocardiopsis]MCY9785770.1 helix-turn-helix domain-containing protein [Nocardiopsis sp. EMB25]
MTAEHGSAPAAGTLITPNEVAALFRVHASTVVRWAREGHLTSLTTPTGRHRFPAEHVHALLTREARTGTERP